MIVSHGDPQRKYKSKDKIGQGYLLNSEKKNYRT